MREIKFRAWWSVGIEKPYMTYIPRVSTGLLNNEILRYDCLMQYTGQKDKNGKEIWEGDIIKQYSFPDFKEGLEDIALIFWSQGEAGFALDWLKAANVQYNNFCWQSYEVIGNRYKNPELWDCHLEVIEDEDN